MTARLHVHYFESGPFAIFDQAGRMVVDCPAGEMSQDDAERVVKRWNLHDELVAVLTEMSELASGPVGGVTVEAKRAILAKAKDVLARAKGGGA